MPLNRIQVETFCMDLAELFSVRTPRFSHRRQIRCRWKKKTLHLGRTVTRENLAHELAHYFHGELVFGDKRRRAGKLHGREFNRWRLLLGNYISQEFGEGEGVTF
jgi:hypothetical protein